MVEYGCLAKAIKIVGRSGLVVPETRQQREEDVGEARLLSLEFAAYKRRG